MSESNLGEITPNDEAILTIPARGGVKKWYQNVQRKVGDKSLGAFRNINSRLEEPRTFSRASMEDAKKLPRYYCRRWNLWKYFNVSDDYKAYLLSLTNHQCRLLDHEANRLTPDTNE